MNQYATVNRFCAIEGRDCEKTIKFNGPWSFFFAYPSNPHMKGFSQELVSELAVRGIRGVRWEDIVKNDLLFSKVCDGIHSNDFLLAEITEPNLNVLLEIGYALAVGRQPLLLQDKNRDSWSRDLLTTLESCFYYTRPDICDYIAGWQQTRPSDTFEPNRRLPFLESMGIFDDQEEEGTVHHLKPKVATDWITRVDRSFSRSNFRFTSMDPSDSVYDEFYPQARQIQRSSLIVASFVSQEYTAYEESNSKVALLTGFSIGLGKQVLVLQQEPAASILDLGSVSRRFEAEGHVQRIVESWIEQQERIFVHQTLESRQRASSKQQVDLLRSIYLGHPDALQDNELLEYFVPTKEYNDAIEGRRTIFVGRRGSGKSANFRAIWAKTSEQPKTINVEILPADFQLERIASFLENATVLPDPRLTFQSIWNYVLTTEMLKALAESTDHLYLSQDDGLRKSLHFIYQSDYDEFDLDFGSRVVSALERVMPSDHDMSLEDRRLFAEEALKSLRNYNLNHLLKDFAKSESLTFFIVADELDKHWRANTAHSVDLLLGLIEEVTKMQRFFETHLKIVLFLREDIYEVIARNDDDFPKRDLLRMEWTSSNLHHLIAARLSKRIDHQDDEEIWTAIFPDPVSNVPASQYILSRSLPRPREVLNLCQKAIDHAQRNGHQYVKSQDILDGERSYSEELIHSVSSEFRGLYPDLEDVLVEFLGIDNKIPWDDFENIAKTAIQIKKDKMANWVDGRYITPQFLSEVLFKIGLIGLSREWESRVYFCNGRSFSETWRLASSNPRRASSNPIVHIHPAFVQALEVSEITDRN